MTEKMYGTSFTQDDVESIVQVVSVKIMNRAAESAYKKLNAEGLYDLSSKPYDHFIKNNLTEDGKKLVPTTEKHLRLTRKGCHYHSCPEIVYALNRHSAVHYSELKLEEVTSQNLKDVSDHCLGKYRKNIQELNDPKMESLYGNPYGYLQWRKKRDGEMGCTIGDESFRALLLYPDSNMKANKGGPIPPLKLFDNNEFELTEAYCRRMKTYHRPSSSPDKHDDDCYLSSAQVVGESFFSYLYRDFWDEW